MYRKNKVPTQSMGTSESKRVEMIGKRLTLYFSEAKKHIELIGNAKEMYRLKMALFLLMMVQ